MIDSTSVLYTGCIGGILNSIKMPPNLILNTNLSLQAHINQQMQSLSIFPPEGGGATEPPPPYPMGNVAMGVVAASPVTVGGAAAASSSTTSSAAPPPPPPSYSQSLAMRQSPTLISSSSDYRLEEAGDKRRFLAYYWPDCK